MEDQGSDVAIWTTIGTAVAMAVTGAIGWFTTRKKREAESAADAAERSRSEAAELANDSIGRALTRMENELGQLRSELDAMRKKETAMAIKIAKLESYVERLTDILRRNNIEPPKFNIGTP